MDPLEAVIAVLAGAFLVVAVYMECVGIISVLTFSTARERSGSQSGPTSRRR